MTCFRKVAVVARRGLGAQEQDEKQGTVGEVRGEIKVAGVWSGGNTVATDT